MCCKDEICLNASHSCILLVDCHITRKSPLQLLGMEDRNDHCDILLSSEFDVGA